MARREYTIFLASPSADTVDARAVVAAAARAINLDPQYQPRVSLTLLRWDDPDRPVALSASTNAQFDILEQMGDPACCDLVIGIFRHGMGGLLPPERFGFAEGSRPWFCTEWEVAQGLRGVERGSVRAVWRFRDMTPFPGRDPRMSTPAWREVSARHDEVSAYFEALTPNPRMQVASLNEYTGPLDLAGRIGTLLRAWVTRQLERDEVGEHPPATRVALADAPPALDADHLTESQQTLHARLIADAEPTRDDAWRQLVAIVGKEPVRGWRGHLLKRHAVWCAGGGGQIDRRFVNLRLMVDRRPGAEGERFVPDERQLAAGHHDDLAELLAGHPDAGAWLLKGDPGAGKSTVLQHHELAMARAALKAIAAGEAPRELCFWVRLSDYGHADAPPAEWLARRWAASAGEHLPGWDAARRRLPIRVLADGLNEIKAPDPVARREARRRWAEWAAGLADEGGPHLPPVFSVRALEIGDGLQAPGLALRHIELGEWSDAQVERYCEARRAPAVWRTLREPRHADLLALCRLPFNAAAQCELHEATGEVVADRAALLSGVIWLRVIHEWDKGASGALAAPGLLGPRDHEPIGAGRWRRSMRALPEEGWLVRGLDAQADHLQRDGKEVSFRESAALAAYELFVAASGGAGRAGPAPASARDWLAAAKALDVICESGVDAYTREVYLRYTHQLWQEFFAGRGLRERVPLPGQPADAALPNFAAPALAPIDEVAARLGTRDPLPGPPVSDWEEPVKLAVQLSTRPADWLRHLRGLNLPLAGRAAALCARRVEADTAGRGLLDQIRAELLARGRDPAVDLRSRVEAADALGALGDPRYVAGEDAGGVRFLQPRPDGWLRFPAGTARIGAGDSAADEGPVTELALAAFEMAFAPVTNAEYRCFIDAGGYDDPRWWAGEWARRWLREGLRNDTEIAWRRELFDDARRDPDAACRRFPNQSAAQREELRLLSLMSEADHEAQLDEYHGARVCRLPLEWANPRFNQPSQPVVGICVFEARAYADWLSARTGRVARLPTEAEWARAAGGTAGRRWPWGDAEPDAPRMNAGPARLGRSSPVGVFPEADSPEGLTDLAGNVWEWTASAHREPLDAAALTGEAHGVDGRRVVRGGSWLNQPEYCRVPCRRRNTALFRGSNLGFRLARSIDAALSLQPATSL